MRPRFKLITLLLFFAWFFTGWSAPYNTSHSPFSVSVALATNYITNPSFTGGTTGWSLTVSTYDGMYYQDSIGSVKTQTPVGRNNAVTGTAQQTIGTNIGSADFVTLTLYWSKQCVSATCAINTVSAQIAKPSDPATWVTIWTDTSTPPAGSPTLWTGPSALDVSSYFNETGTYLFRIYMDLRNPNNPNAQALAWVDNINLDVIPPVASVSVTDGTVAYGINAVNTAESTLPGELADQQTATNDGTATENFNIQGQDASGGGCTWTLAGANGSDQYIHQFCNETALDCTSPPTNYTALTTSYQSLATGVTSSGIVLFELRLTTPTASSCYNEQAVNVTVQAVIP